MKTVWKFPIEATENQSVKMPTGATILHVAAQGSGLKAQPCIWAMVDTEAAPVMRLFAVCGTGHAADWIGGKHIGSFLLGEGVLVFHVFDMGEEKERLS